MTELMRIKEKAQAVANALNAALGVEVEIVDQQLTIVVGTGRYSEKIGLKEEQGDLGSGYLYSEALRTGKSYIIEKGETHPTYAPEENELAEICCPIFFEGRVIGLLGLVAFDESQRKVLLAKKDGLLLLLREIVEYLSCRVKELNMIPEVSSKVSGDFISGDLHELVEKIGESLSNVLITGESGTGKGMLAREIHRNSLMKFGPFVPVNCGAIPENLLESELFGYEEGAFTGAKEGGKIGWFEIANNGTIFLDEIGDMPPALQVKLLHVLQHREIQRVGGSQYLPINIRVIAATNKDLEKLMDSKHFREDLYYRLSVIPIHIKSLRERRGELGNIIDHILGKLNQAWDKEISGFTPEARQMLMDYSWPGNIRELENVLEYSFNMVRGNEIGKEDLPPYLVKDKQDLSLIRPLKEQWEEAEKNIILDCLNNTGRSLEGKIKAAELLGISESTLYRRLKVLGIQ